MNSTPTLYLSKDVFLVKGHARSAVYDLAQEVLYQVSQDVSALVERVNGQRIANLNLDKDETEAVFKLRALGIFTDDETDKNYSSIREIGEVKTPDFAWIEVTRRCNLACIHCYEESSPLALGRMETDEFYAVADKLERAGISRVQFIGGEPLVHRDLAKMISYARPKFADIEVYTNGLLINDQWADFFAKNDINIALSMHSYRAIEHDKVTKRRGSHAKVEASIKILRSKGIEPRIAGVNVAGVDFGKQETQDYEIGQDVVRLAGRARPSMVSFELFAKKAITKENFKRRITKAEVSSNARQHQCFSKSIYISSNAGVYPCVMERRRSHGDLSKSELDQIISPEITAFNKDSVEGCKDCELRYACFDCRPDSNGGTFDEKPWYCTYDEKRGKWLDLTSAYMKYTASIADC